jgi:hypothetical protein
LGRAVIGGLIFGTSASLFLVPLVFAAVRQRFRPGERRRIPENAGAIRKAKTEELALEIS